MSFWKRTYYPPRGADRLRNHGDYAATRARFYRRPHSNLRFLIRERYAWMNPYLAGRRRVVELGAGPGLSREFLPGATIELTDVVKNEWLDSSVDALHLPYPPGSLDAVICSHMIHHVLQPAALLEGIRSALKPGGVLLINEAKASLCHRLLMWAMRHEGWSYDVDVFDTGIGTKALPDPLAGNNAVADLLFNDPERFERAFPDLSIRHDEFVECLVFLLSGGVGGEVFTLELPDAALRVVQRVDRFLIAIAPNIFALARQVVIVKNERTPDVNAPHAD